MIRKSPTPLHHILVCFKTETSKSSSLRKRTKNSRFPAFSVCQDIFLGVTRSAAASDAFLHISEEVQHFAAAMSFWEMKFIHFLRRPFGFTASAVKFRNSFPTRLLLRQISDQIQSISLLQKLTVDDEFLEIERVSGWIIGFFQP